MNAILSTKGRVE